MYFDFNKIDKLSLKITMETVKTREGDSPIIK